MRVVSLDAGEVHDDCRLAVATLCKLSSIHFILPMGVTESHALLPMYLHREENGTLSDFLPLQRDEVEPSSKGSGATLAGAFAHHRTFSEKVESCVRVKCGHAVNA